MGRQSCLPGAFERHLRSSALPPLHQEVPIRQLRKAAPGAPLHPARGTAFMFTVLAATARSAGEGPSDAHLQPRHPSCSFNANITDANGVQSEPDKPCFLCRTSCYSGPATVEVTGAEAESVVVWDTETGICPDGQLYIHYVHGHGTKDMTAGAGAEIHTYKACVFDDVPVSATGCQTFSGNGCRVNLDDCATHEWRVAREGSSC